MKKNVIITGASSGIGKAMSLYHAKMGDNIFLFGRNKKNLEEIVESCKRISGQAECFVADITDEILMKKLILEIDILHPVDLIYANAGISAGTSSGLESDKQTRLIFATNVGGVINTISPIIPRMKVRHSGQIVIMSSISAMRGLPSAPSYSASKAAVLYYGEALRGLLLQDNVRVSVVCPGYIKTPMTDANKFYMPFLMSTEKAVLKIAKGLQKNKAFICFPLFFYYVTKFASLLPNSITDPIFARLPGKNSF